MSDNFLDERELSKSGTTEITFLQGLAFLKKNIKFSAIGTALIFCISILYSFNQPNIYRSSGIYEIANSGESSSPAETQGLSSIAGAVGVSLGKPASNKADVIIETVRSKGYLNEILKIEGISPKLFATESYDINTQVLTYDSSLFDGSEWIGEEPSIHQVHKVYSKSLSIRQDNGDGFIYLSFQHQSPAFAKEFLVLVVNQLNATMRSKAASESANSIDFLTAEFMQTNWLEIRNSISSLLQDQFETQMLANVREEYALKPIESPFEEEEKFAPSRLAIIIWWTLAAFVLMNMIAFLKEVIRNQAESISS
jgi:hypothetical protein|tara:strand:+ start:236 stop:1168 length:933 start_codon:yes stop_codon:yes gene_type:complete